MKNKLWLNLKLIPIVLLLLGGVSWVAVTIYAFNNLEGPTQTGLSNDVFYIIYYLALVLSVSAAISFSYIYSKKHKLLWTAGCILVMVIGFAIYQVHENNIANRTIRECIQSVGYNPQVSHAYITKSSDSDFSRTVLACYGASSRKAMFQDNQLVIPE